jgi:hypothetical protein
MLSVVVNGFRMYVAPVLVGWAQDASPQHFQDGYFATLGAVQGGRGLSLAMVIFFVYLSLYFIASHTGVRQHHQ